LYVTCTLIRYLVPGIEGVVSASDVPVVWLREVGVHVPRYR